MTLVSGFVEHVIDLLHDFGGVSARRMFGGYGLYRRGVMFALVFEDVLYLKVDQINRPDFIAAGMEPFTYEHNSAKTVEMPYWQAPSELFDDAEAMVHWADRAFGAALRSRGSAVGDRSRRPPRPGLRGAGRTSRRRT